MNQMAPNFRQTKDAPVVSVIMPAYNVAPFIGAALESVFAQTFANFEVIVVNDGSPDTEELERALAPYQRRICYITQENRGVSAARNVAIRAARGTFVALLDPDDLWEPNYLVEQLAAFAGDPSADVIYPDALMFGDAAEAGRLYMDWCRSEGEVTLENIFRGRCHVMGSLMARREALVKVGLFDEDLRSCEDFDLWLRVLQSGSRISYHRRMLVRYRRRRDSHTSDFERLSGSFLRVLDKTERTFNLSPGELDALRDKRKQVLAEAALENGKRALFRGDTESALADIRTANAHFKSARLTLVTLFMHLMPGLLRRAYQLRHRNPRSAHQSSSGSEALRSDATASDSDKKSGSLTRRALLLMFAKGWAYVFGFALPLLLVRRLSQTEFGLYKQAFLIVGTASSILPLGFTMSAYYFLPRESERRGSIVLNIMLFNSFAGGLALLTLVLWPKLIETIFNSPTLVPYASLIGALILIWAVSYFLEISALANQEVGVSTIFIIAAQVTKTALLFAAAIGFPSVRALLYAAMIQGGLQILVLIFYLRSRFGNFWRKFDWSMMREQLGYALPIGFGALLYVVLMDLHNYFVSYRFGAEAFAIYAIGCFSLPLVGIIGESVGPVLIPSVSRLQKEGKIAEIVLVAAGAMRKLSIIYFPLYALLLVVGKELIAFLFTAQYLGSWPIFAINLSLLPFMILVADPIIRAHAEHRFFLLKLRAVTIVVLFTALWVGTKYLGLVGAISAMICVSIADRLIEAIKAWRIVNVTWRDIVLIKDVGKVAVAALAAGSLTAVVRLFALGQRPFIVLFVCGLAFGCFYISFLWLLGIPSVEEREAIRNKLGRVQSLFWPKRTFEPLT
jgi:glycosyltransferase involved in cell wall biosynthesis/O-antigen/teichoic acid export membrane protein